MSVATTGVELFTSILQYGNAFMKVVFHALSVAFANGWERSILTLYITIVGYSCIKGKVQNWKEWVASIVVLTIFQASVVESSTFIDFFAIPLQEFLLGMAGWVQSATGSNAGGGAVGISAMFAHMDNMMAVVTKVAGEMHDSHAGMLTSIWTNMKLGIALTALFLVYGAVYCLVFVLMTIGFLILDILFTVAPLWLFFGCFKETRFVMWAWFRAVMNYSVLVVFVSIAAALALFSSIEVTNKLVVSASSVGVFSFQYGAALLIGIFSAYLLLKTPDLAAALTGGQAGSTAAIAGGLALAGGAMYTNLKMGGMKLGKKMGRGAWNSAPGQWARNTASDAWYGAKGAAMQGAANVGSGLGRGAMSGARTAASGVARAYSAMKGVRR